MLIVLNDGTVYGCGSDGVGELGPKTKPLPFSSAIEQKKKQQQVEEGDEGDGNNNENDDTDNVPNRKFHKLNVPKCKLVCALANSSVFVLWDSKTVMTCGTDSYGQNGNKNNGPTLTRVQFKVKTNEKEQEEETRPIVNLHGGWHHCCIVFGYKTKIGSGKFQQALHRQIKGNKLCDMAIQFSV